VNANLELSVVFEDVLSVADFLPFAYQSLQRREVVHANVVTHVAPVD
jgi:hypothetical protein